MRDGVRKFSLIERCCISVACISASHRIDGTSRDRQSPPRNRIRGSRNNQNDFDRLFLILFAPGGTLVHHDESAITDTAVTLKAVASETA